MGNKNPRPIPPGERVTFKRKDYLVEPDGTVHTLYEAGNFMSGSEHLGRKSTQFRKLRDQASPLAVAVRAVPKILAAAKNS